MRREGRRVGMTSATILSIILILLLAGVSAAWLDNTGVSPSEVSSLQNQVNTLQNRLQSVNSSINGYWNKKIDPLQSAVRTLNSSVNNYWKSLPLMNQTPTSRDIWVQWEKTQSGQDRFNPSMIIVNQGDTVHLTFISNDTVTHTFTVGAPYNFQINASMPGLYNDLTGKEFTTPALHNSPGVEVFGRPGNVTATGTFVARYAGIYEFVCTYHVQVGMFGYLVVLPNAAYTQQNQSTVSATTTTSARQGSAVQVSIVNGAYNPNASQTYVPDTVTIVIGVNNTVSWTNNDAAPHTVTSDSGLFNSGNMNPGESWTYTFTTPGTYSYHCDYHPWMKGVVVVKGG